MMLDACKMLDRLAGILQGTIRGLLDDEAAPAALRAAAVRMNAALEVSALRKARRIADRVAWADGAGGAGATAHAA